MKKNNMGFTLIELLSVIALLGVLAFVIIPNIESILKNSKGSLYDKQIDLIETAAKLWSSDEKYKILLEKNESWPYVITLSDLQYFNFIEKDINNPKTKTPFSENTLILITKSNGKYVFNVEETTDDHLSPIITLNGDKDIQVEINSLYTELGATVKKNNVDVIVTTKIQENGVVVSSIDNSKVGSYMIIYTAIFTDENNIVHTGMAFRRIKFVDTTPPVITCSSCKNLTIIESDANYVFPEVTVTDNSGEKIKAKIIGSFSSIIPGEKKIIYQAIDSSSNVTNYEVFFLVKDTIQPELTFSTSYIVNNDSIEYVAYASDSGSGIKDYSFDGGNTWQKSNKAVKRCDSTVILMTRDNALNVTSITSSEKCIPQFVYNYTGNYQTFVAPYTGWYKIELWGAGGGTYALLNTSIAGRGGYTKGTIMLNKNDTLYVYIGERGLEGTYGIAATSTVGQGGKTTFNGGGAGGNAGGGAYPYQYYIGGPSGGGATDIRLVNGSWNDFNSLKNRIMVAGGGGGSSNLEFNLTNVGQIYNGGNNIGLYGVSGTTIGNLGAFNYIDNAGIEGTQSSGNAFGIGGRGDNSGETRFCHGHGAGGGGYYGGGGAKSTGGNCYIIGGGGGSSFISGYAGVNAVTASSSLTHSNNTIHYSSKYFIDGTMEAGVNVGHGKAKITLIEEPKKINLSLNKVRYIKDCINGSNINTFNHWIELQAIKNGVNVAKDKNVIGSASLVDLNYPYSRAVDGDITASKYAGSNQSNSCITVDLGQVYDLDEIAVWHYYADGRTYNNNITSVSNNNTDWITVINKTEPETPNGKRVSAYSN